MFIHNIRFSIDYTILCINITDRTKRTESKRVVKELEKMQLSGEK